MTRERLEQGVWGVAGVGVVGCAIGWIMNAPLFAPAWLAALTLFLGWPLGSMALLLVHAVTGGRWGFTIRPALVAGVATTPLILVALVPLIFLMHPLYGWMSGHVPNARYLNMPFWWGRVGGYVLVWIVLSLVIAVVMPRADTDRGLRLIAPVGLIVLAVSGTLSAVDMILSIDPRFNSTAFGMIMCAEWTLFAMAVAVFWTALLEPAQSRGMDGVGKVLLVLVVLWGYLDFVQFLIVWNSDLAIDAPWYLARAERGWGIVAYVLFVFHFAVPVMLLPFAAVRRSRRFMLVLSAMIMAAEVPRAWWLVVPTAQRSLSWVDVCAMFVMIGVPLALGLRGGRLRVAVVQHA